MNQKTARLIRNYAKTVKQDEKEYQTSISVANHRRELRAEQRLKLKQVLKSL